MPPRLTISPDLLRALAALSAGETLTDAARRLGISQSAVSLRLKKLEEDLGVQLVHRNGRGTALTGAGELVYGYACRILALNDEMFQSLEGLKVEGRLRLGLPADLAEDWLAGALADFIESHPRVHVEVSVERSAKLLADLQAGDLDLALALTLTPPEGGELLAELPVCWIGRRDQPLTLAPAGELALVLLSAPCLFRDIALAALDTGPLAPRIAMTSASLGGMAAAIGAGLGIGIRTTLGLPPHLAPLKDPRLPVLRETVSLGLYHAGVQSPAARALAAIARRSLASASHEQSS